MISNLLKNLFGRLSSPLPLREGLGVGLFLLMGSASLMAQDSDPFPSVPYNNYSGNMTCTVEIDMGGIPLTEGVVAFYKGDDIRGKASIGNVVGYLDKAQIIVSGNSQPETLYVKVYTGGRTIEVAPADLKYTLNGTVGSFSSPYVINLPVPVVTTPSAEGWATTCLPFNAEVPQGVTVWYGTGIANSELIMEKATGTILPADTPVLLQSSGLSSYEWLARVADGDITTPGSIFVGTTEEKTVTEKTVLTLGHSNEGNHEIGFWLYDGNTIHANRAYITSFPTNTRGVTFKFEDETGISEVHNSQFTVHSSQFTVHNDIYDLQGRRIAPSIFNHQSSIWKKGHQGQIIIVK